MLSWSFIFGNVFEEEKIGNFQPKVVLKLLYQQVLRKKISVDKKFKARTILLSAKKCCSYITSAYFICKSRLFENVAFEQNLFVIFSGETNQLVCFFFWPARGKPLARAKKRKKSWLVSPEKIKKVLFKRNIFEQTTFTNKKALVLY